MICAIIAKYKHTAIIIGSAMLIVKYGVRQGAPTSGLLFIMVIEQLIRTMKEHFPYDGFLKWLSILAFMDDIIIFSTSKKTFIDKSKILDEFCNENNICINDDKSKFFCDKL